MAREPCAVSLTDVFRKARAFLAVWEAIEAKHSHLCVGSDEECDKIKIAIGVLKAAAYPTEEACEPRKRT